MARSQYDSDYELYNYQELAHVGRSNFDLSHRHDFTTVPGALYPVACIPTLPGDDHTITVQALIKTIPMVVQPLTHFRAFFHAYLCYDRHAWHKFKISVSRGRSGQYVGDFPYLSARKPDGSASPDQLYFHCKLGPSFSYDASTYMGIDPQGGLMSALYGFPFSFKSDSQTDFISQVAALRVSAIPAYDYQRIYRDYYLDADLNQSDIDTGQNEWFPIDDDDFSLSDGVSVMRQDFSRKEEVNSIGRGDYYGPRLCLMRYRNWRKDYFTNAKPWAQRGTPPEIALTAGLPDQLRVGVNSSGIFNPASLNAAGWSSSAASSFASNSAYKGQMLFGIDNQDLGSRGDVLRTEPLSGLSSGISALTVERLRSLFLLNLWQERNGRADGDYNSLIMAQYGVNPHADDGKPIYIGGCYQDIVVSDVLQTFETDTSRPLGSAAGRGVSAASGYIGKCHSSDFGHIIILMSILPEQSYMDGIKRYFTRETFADYPWPLFAGLGPQSILNKELLAFHKDALTVVEQDENGEDILKMNDLFGYQNRFDEYRFERNRVSNSLADPTDTYWFSHTLARHFTAYPTLTNSFVEANSDTIRYDVWATGKEECPFLASVGFKWHVARKLPYYSTPIGL